MVVDTPAARPTRPDYTDSGWPFFEISVADLISNEPHLLGITAALRASLLEGEFEEYDYMKLALVTMGRNRSGPLEPFCAPTSSSWARR